MGSGIDPRDTHIDTTVLERSAALEADVRRAFNDPDRRALHEATREHTGEFSRLVNEVNLTLDRWGWPLRTEDRVRLIDNTEAVESGERSRVGGHLSEVATFTASTLASLRDGELREAAHSATGVLANTMAALAAASIEKPEPDFGD